MTKSSKNRSRIMQKSVRTFPFVVIFIYSHYQLTILITIRIGVYMSLKILFLHSYLIFFPKNFGMESDEHDERFHEQMKAMEKRYQGVWDEAMMSDYNCFLIRETNPKTYKRRSEIQNNF